MKILSSSIRAAGAVSGILLGAIGAWAQGTSPAPSTAAGPGAGPQAAKASEIRGVVELFTSQGCSSCPPADIVLGKLAKRPDLLVLSMPVDYWDYLGWKDTFASPGNTARQKAYARARGDGQVYTPQAVINGQLHVNGSVESQIDGALRQTAGKADAPRIALKGWTDKDTVVIQAGNAAGATPVTGTLLLAMVQRQGEVAIGRGENHGRKVVYTNIVRQLKPVGEWNGREMTVRIPRAELTREGADFGAILLQQGPTGPILAAAEIKMP